MVNEGKPNFSINLFNVSSSLNLSLKNHLSLISSFFDFFKIEFFVFENLGFFSDFSYFLFIFRLLFDSFFPFFL